MIEHQLIFPTQVFRAQYQPADELQRTVVPILLEQEKNDQKPLKYTANGYTDYGRENLLERPVFKDLKEFIDDVVVRCHKQTGYKTHRHLKAVGLVLTVNTHITKSIIIFQTHGAEYIIYKQIEIIQGLLW